MDRFTNERHFHTKETSLLAVPFWIVGRARQPKTHSAARLERGEVNEKRLGGSGKERNERKVLASLPGASACSLYFSAISRALSTIQKGAASNLKGNNTFA